VVVDLGSGAGLDALRAARRVGPHGLVLGVDMTPEMVALARSNAVTVGVPNVHFLVGELESLPLADASADVVVSNCVINLVPDKRRAFQEAYRILRPGGRLVVSDVVAAGPLPPRGARGSCGVERVRGRRPVAARLPGGAAGGGFRGGGGDGLGGLLLRHGGPGPVRDGAGPQTGLTELVTIALMQPLVGVIMGSRSDWETLRHAAEILDELGVPYEVRVVSAHRTPDLLYEYAQSAEARGLEVIIAGAGGAAHLPGMTAAKTVLPVLGVPVESHALRGLDSLLSIVQMPAGVPVGTLAIGRAGAVNAALLAAAILGNKYPHIRDSLRRYRAAQTQAVLQHPDPREGV
jgi:5-(carboxyamino)imidazole ribonucleotide mutase